MKTLFFLLSIAFLLAGCATPYDVDIEEQNTLRVTSHATMQQDQVKSRANAAALIAGSYNCNDPDSKDCGAVMALMAYRGFEALERIEPDQYEGPTGRTGVDVQYKLADQGLTIASVVTNGVVSNSAIRNSKQNVTMTGDGNSYEHNESHTTTLGDENAVTTAQTKNPEPVAEEEAVEEEVVTEEVVE